MPTKKKKNGGGNAHDRKKQRTAGKLSTESEPNSPPPLQPQPEPQQAPHPEKEPTFKWRDAIGLVGLFIGIGGTSDMPLALRLICFSLCAVCGPVSISSHKKWPLPIRWGGSIAVVVLMSFISFFAITHPQEHFPTAAEIAKAVVSQIGDTHSSSAPQASPQGEEKKPGHPKREATEFAPPDPKYPPSQNPLVRMEGTAVPASNQMCTGLQGDDRIKCLCPDPMKYTLSALPTPSDNNYATELQVKKGKRPFYHLRAFARTMIDVRHGWNIVPPLEGHGSAALGVFDYDPYTFTLTSTYPLDQFNIEVRSAEGLRLYCINEIN